jgi:hypothetical protein
MAEEWLGNGVESLARVTRTTLAGELGKEPEIDSRVIDRVALVPVMKRVTRVLIINE